MLSVYTNKKAPTYGQDLVSGGNCVTKKIVDEYKRSFVYSLLIKHGVKKMKSIKVVSGILLVIGVSFAAHAGTAYLKSEQITGMTKQCYYDYLGNTYTRTVKSHELCPMSIQV